VYRSNVEDGAADGHQVDGDWPENPNDPNHSIDSDPLFVDSSAGDYRLRYLSPSKDFGDYEFLPCDDYDIAPGINGIEDLNCDNDEKHPIDLDGNERVMDGGVAFQVDHGAYEFLLDCGNCPEDLNNDGVVNVSDMLVLFDCWGTGFPSGCECADLNQDGEVNVSDVLALFDAWGPCPNWESQTVPQAVLDCFDLYDEHGLSAVIDCLDQL
jgi:hypothetical protein